MKALSVKQPWAWLIVHGYKNVENRNWRVSRRYPLPMRIRIHASGGPVSGKKWEEVRSTIEECGHGETLAWIARDRRGAIRRFRANGELGAIVGEVTLVECVEDSDSCWFCGPNGFLLARPRAYRQPIPCKGRLFFFDPGV